jgi:nitroreductase
MAMNVLHAIETRRSPAKLSAPGPTDAQIERLLFAAAHAPDHGRLSPWRFAVLRAEGRQRLAEAMAAALRRKHPEAPPEALETERAKAQRAPIIIAVATHAVAGHKVPEIEQWLAVGAAIQNLLLAAHAMGFGALWKTGGAAHDDEIAAALGFAPSERIAGFIYLGTPAAAPKPREFNVADHVRWL